ncbi:MAG: hypothetical protein QNJ55_15000 [Xenococcus sp. MO_188.B8]|nr:hypothetical protein [Xenococcus sp. MO_188.B8]
MIYFKDFFPQTIEQKGFFSEDKYEKFSSLLSHVNQWLSENKVKLINIETVVLRDIDDEKTRFLAEEPFFYQFMRVWYEIPDADCSTNTGDVESALG